MIDLHLHTTASDGRSTPDELARRAEEVGLDVIAVTDHYTMAGVAPTARAVAPRGIAVVPGIEITSAYQGQDVHVLGYYVDPESPALQALLAAHREARIDRARAIARRLEEAGAPVDIDPMLAAAMAAGASVARPQIAAALVAAGHVASISEAFERLIGEGRPAYVPHCAKDPAEVVAAIGRAGGVASLAHPGTLGRDELIPALVAAGLVAIEAYHSAHDAAQQRHYVQLAERYDLAVTGGSDYHGEGVRRAECLGVVGLPRHEFERFQARAAALAGPLERFAAAGVAGRIV